jgi:hypothetical protein
MLAVLSETPNEWVSQVAILNLSEQRRRCGMTVHSRASDLRNRGHVIENRCERVGTRTVSYYRLVTPLSQPDVADNRGDRSPHGERFHRAAGPTSGYESGAELLGVGDLAVTGSAPSPRDSGRTSLLSPTPRFPCAEQPPLFDVSAEAPAWA